MVFLGLMFAGVVLRNSHIDGQGKNVDIRTPVGEFKVNQDPSHSSGLPLYPGATVSDKSDHANIQMMAGEAGIGIAVEQYVTPDSLEKVAAWYAQRLGPSFRREKPSGQANVHGVNVGTDVDVTFTDDHGDGARVVGLKQKDDEVEISLVRVGKREAQ
jgi:hypothetical protein